MPKSRAELEEALRLLESNLGAMAELTDPAPHASIERESIALLHSAAPEDAEFVRARLNCMFGSAGLIPSDNEGEPCT